MASFKQILGTFVYDWPRLVGALARSGHWMFMRNRNDVFTISPDRSGVRCDWLNTRPLHLCDVFPITAQWLMRRALRHRPIKLQGRPEYVSEELVCSNGKPAETKAPDVSFLIGHRGIERMPLLLATLKSIAVQEDVLFECIVVEQDESPTIQGELPDWVQYLHSPNGGGQPYNRSRAFNEAARIARGRVLILHDNDIMVPAVYASAAIERYIQGYAISQLKRFIFYLNEISTNRVLESDDGLRSGGCEQVIENLCGGGSLAVSKEAYLYLGGMDEEFVGWGGEDEEFWDRCKACRVREFACLPFVHLWHSPAPGKRTENANSFRLREVSGKSIFDRIKSCRQASGIKPESPVVDGLVSCIIPVYNRAVFLKQAVESVLQQTYRPIEIVLVDDGSTDGTAQEVDRLAARYPDEIRVVHQDNAGPGAAREAGRLIAKGEYIQYLDSDDVLLPGKFEKLVGLLRLQPDCGIAYGVTALVNQSLEIIEPVYKETGVEHKFLFPKLLVERWWNTHTPLFRRSVTGAVGAWPNMRMSEDWVYDARVGALKIKLCHCPETLSLTRKHDEGRLTHQGLPPRILADIAKLLHELYRTSLQAGVSLGDHSMDHFARRCFLETRRCSEVGLVGDACALYRLALSVSGRNRRLRTQLIIYRIFTRLAGWKITGIITGKLRG